MIGNVIKATKTEGPQRFSSPQNWFILDSPIVRDEWPDSDAVCVVINPAEDIPGAPGGTAGFSYESDATVYPASSDGPRIIEGEALLVVPRGLGLTIGQILASIGVEIVEEGE